MAERTGCWKGAAIGCLGLIALVVAFVVLGTVIVRTGTRAPRVEDATSRPEVVATGGRIVVDVSQAEFTIFPGERLEVDARFDAAAYDFVDSLEVLPDSSWVYTLSLERTETGLAAALRQIFTDEESARIRLTIPSDRPIALDIRFSQAGFEADIGGLWLTTADIDYSMGGFNLDVSRPLREPLERLSVRGSMGGFEATSLGNASPREIMVSTSMGGAELDLGGLWLRDSDIDLTASMGGVEVRLPDGVRVTGIDDPGGGRLEPADPEVALPTLRFRTSASMGGVEVSR